MDKTDMSHFAELMAFLAQNFTTTLSAVDIENYWRFLRVYSIGDIEQAIVNYCRNPEGHAFMPKPGEIIAYIKGNSDSQAMLAWVKVIKAVKHIGAYSNVIFDDALIHAVLEDMGGWIKLCHCPEKELPYRMHEFVKRYTSYLVNKPTGYPKQLIGIMHHNNTRYGFESNPSILIGDATNAYNVYKNGQLLNKLVQYKPMTQELVAQLDRLSHTEDNQSSFNKLLEDSNKKA